VERQTEEMIKLSGEWEKYLCLHPNTVMHEDEFKRLQNSLKVYAEAIASCRYPLSFLEWRSFGDTTSEAVSRAKEVVNGSEPTWQECVRYEAFYIRVYTVAKEGYTEEKGYLPHHTCLWCGNNISGWHGTVVCSNCAKDAGIKVLV